MFTPNNDGVNDFSILRWMLNGLCWCQSWGRIYHWDNINETGIVRLQWKKNREGVYFYRMSATGLDGSHFEENGSVT